MKRAFYLIFLFLCSCITPQYLTAQATVQGVVTNSNGAPISGAGVGIFLGKTIKYSTMTNINGSYSISGVTPNSYSIQASANNFLAQSVGIYPTDNETLNQNFQLVPANTGQIVGTVVIANSSTPISGAKISASLANVLFFTATTNGNGQYAIPNLGSGSYVVTATATGFQASPPLSVGVSTANTTIQNFQLQPNTSALTGQVIAASSGMPLSGVLIAVKNTQTGEGYSTFTDTSGFYTFSGLGTGTWQVTAQPPPTLNFQISTQSAQITANATTVLNFALEPLVGAVAGTVSDASTGAPIPGATINVFQNNTLIQSVLTTQNGQYNISSLAPGSYSVQAQANLFQTQTQGANVNGNATSTVNFSLLPDPGTISGLVTDTAANPIPSVLVSVYDGQVLIGSGFTDASGNYSISQIPPGTYTVNASQENFQTQSTGATVTSNATTPINFVLQSIFGGISGTVTNSSFQVIPGASVFAFSSQQIFLLETITDASGFYTFTNLAPGDFSILATADGYQTAFQKATVTANTTTTGVDFILQISPGKIVGTVTTAADGTPISGAIVEVFSNFTSVATVPTDPKGEYVISGLAPGNYIVNVRATSFQTEVKETHVLAGTTNTVDFSLRSDPGAISGTVTDAATSLPIGGARIKVFNDQQVLIRTTLTQPNGFYQIPLLASGSYTVRASQDNFQTKSLGATVIAPATTSDVNFTLLPDPGTIAGTVTDAITTQSIVGASVFVFDKLILKGEGLTDKFGSYSISNLAPGSYTVLVNAGENYHITTQGATVSSNATTTVNFPLQPNPGQIAGTVTNKADGTPIPQANIRLFSNFTFIGSVLTDTNGMYLFPGLAPGNYSVVASAHNFSTDFVGAIDVASNNTTTVNIALSPNPGMISGIVSDASTSAPLPSATVQVYNGLVLVGVAVTDTNGAYTVSGLLPDTYTVTAFASGFQKQMQTVTVDSNQTTTVNFSLNSINIGSISGMVISAATSNPIPNATVAVFQGTTLLDFTLTDANGNYTISDLAPGKYVVLATAKGFEAAISVKTVVAGATTQANFALNSKPGKIVGKVTDKCTGNPIPGALILATKNSLIFSFGLSDDSGNYSVVDLAAGSYTVTASKKDFVTGSSQVMVTSNATTKANFSLLPVVEPPASISGRVIKNKFLTQTDIIHSISWTASPSECVKGYQIFRNGHKIAFVSSKDKLEYLDHNRHKKGDVYSVKTVNKFGQVSTAVTVTVGHR